MDADDDYGSGLRFLLPGSGSAGAGSEGDSGASPPIVSERISPPAGGWHPITETFATPDDAGEPLSSELHSSLVESLGAQFGGSFLSGVRNYLLKNAEFSAAQGIIPDFGGPAPPGLSAMFDPATVPTMPIADAKARVKQEGLDGIVTLPDQETIREPVLDLMLRDGREKLQYAAAVNRGPQGYLPDALGFLTQIGAGMIDPINAAAFAIPLVGALRLAPLVAEAR